MEQTIMSGMSMSGMSGVRRASALLLAIQLVASCGSSRAVAAEIDDVLVLAEAADAPGLHLPSAAERFGTFEQVSAAVQADRERIAMLEARLKQVEQQAAAAETLPAPKAKDATASKDKAADKDKKPPEPYEVGTDKAYKAKWADTFQAESANKDFRVKIGGRTQVDAVAFSAGAGPNQSPDKGGLDPELADTVNFRRARFRMEGRMYEVYDWACEYDFVNQINVNNETYPTERDAGPLTAVTDLWMQIREVPLLGIVRVGNQKDPYGYEHLTSSRWLNFMERS
ncbi:MAG: porin, partial [Planctomycetota bacterium]